MKTCGLDVHKDSVFCAIHNGKKCEDVKEFTTLTDDLLEMGKMLKDANVKQIAMESTSIYWIPVWNILEELGFELMLVNPFLIKQMPGRKSDVKDAQWIATLLQKGMLRGSLVPDKTIRELRSYSRKYVKLTQKTTSILQSMDRTLHQCNIKITNFVSRIESKSVFRVIEKLILKENDPDMLLELIHGRITNKHKTQIKKSLKGHIPEHHRFNLEQLKDEYDLNEKQKQQCLAKMRTLCNEHYKQELELLMTLDGTDELAAMILIAETGADMKNFENSGKLTGWAGLRPRNDESAGKYKSTATTKGNKFLRCILVQMAWGASRKKNSIYNFFFNRLIIRKSRKKALIAVARKLLTVVWNMLEKKEVFNPNLIVIQDPLKVAAKMKYHQKALDKLSKIK